MTFVPGPFKGNYNKIEKAAEQFREWMDAEFEIRQDPNGETRRYLREIVERLGGTIRVSDSPSPLEETGGSLRIRPMGEGFEIRLSPTTSVYRDNFTIAHELGHYVLHYPHGDTLSEAVHFARYGSNPVEWQANRFAAALLMPRDRFLQKVKEFNDDVSLLSAYFEVSRQAVEVRKEYVK